MASRCQGTAICLSHLRSHDLTATDTTLTTVGTHCFPCSPQRHRLSDPDSGTSIALYVPKKVFNEAVGRVLLLTSLFFEQMVEVTLTDLVRKASPTFSLLRGLAFWAVLLWSVEEFLMVPNQS